MDAVHVWSVVLPVGLEVVLLAAGGDTIRAYLSDYEISSSASDTSSSTMAIRNVGLLQSTNTLAVITMNGTVGIVDKMCPEGSIVQDDEHTLVVFFQHMTYGMPCVIDLHGAVVPQITLFTAKGLPEAEVVLGEGRSYGVWNLAIGIGVIGQFAIGLFTIWIYHADLRNSYWSLRSSRYTKTKNADNIINCIKTVYDIKVNHQKASVIETVIDRPLSPLLISQRLSLPIPYVRILLRCLQDDGLMTGVGVDSGVREEVEKVIRPPNSRNETAPGHI